MSYIEQSLKDFIGIVKQKEQKQQLVQIQQSLKSLFQQSKGQSQIQQNIPKKTIQTLFNQAYLQLRAGQDKNEYICINLLTTCLKSCEQQGDESIEITVEQISHIIAGTVIPNEQYMLAVIGFINYAIYLGLLRSKELELKTLIKLTIFFHHQKSPRSLVEQCLYKLFSQMLQTGDAIAASQYLLQTISPECQQVTINGTQLNSCGSLIAIGTTLYCIRQKIQSKLLNDIVRVVLNIKPGFIDEYSSKLLYSTPIIKANSKNYDTQESKFVNADYFSITKFIQNMAQNKIKFQTTIINAQLYHCFLLAIDKRLEKQFKILYIKNIINSVIYFLTVSFQLQNQVTANAMNQQNQQSMSLSNSNTEIMLSKSYVNLLQQNPNDGSQVSTFMTPIYNFSKLEPCIEVLQYLQFYLLQSLNNFILYKNLGESEAIQIVQYFYWLFVGNGIIDLVMPKHKLIQRYLMSNLQFNISVFNQNASDMEFLNTIFLYNEGHIQNISNKTNIQISFIVIESIFQVMAFIKGIYVANVATHEQNSIHYNTKNDNQISNTSNDQTETQQMKTSQLSTQCQPDIQYGSVPYLNQESIGQLFDVLMRLVKLVQNTTESKYIFSVTIQSIFNIVKILDSRCLNYHNQCLTKQNSDQTGSFQEINQMLHEQQKENDKEQDKVEQNSQNQQEEISIQSNIVIEEAEDTKETENVESNVKEQIESSNTNKANDSIENSQQQSEQISSICDNQTFYRLGYVDDYYEKAKRYALQLPKLVAGVDELLPWVKLVGIQNQFTVSCVFNHITQSLPKLHCIRPQELMDGLLSIVSTYVSFYNCNVNYATIRSFIQQHNDDQFARGVTNVLNFNENVKNDELLLQYRSHYKNTDVYLQALCVLIHSDLCNAEYKDLFSHILQNEINYTDNDIVQVFSIIIDQLNNMARAMLHNKSLRENFKFIVVQLLQYQLCAQQAEQLQNVPAPYKRINPTNSNKINSLELYKIIEQQFSTSILDMNNSEYFSRIILELLEFSDLYKLSIAGSVPNIIQHIKQLYEIDRVDVTQEFVWLITSFLQQINTEQDYKAYNVENQICIFEILTDLITNLYEGQLNANIDSQAIYQLIETFYLHIQDLQVLYQLHQFIQLQACNQINHKQVKLLINYIQMSQILLMKTQESYLIINTFKENLRSIAIYSLIHMYYNKIGLGLESCYLLSHDQQLVELYDKYMKTTYELLEFVLQNEITSQYAFMIFMHGIALVQKNLENNQIGEILELQVSFILNMLANQQMVDMLLNQDTQQIHAQFLADMETLTETLGPQFNYSKGEVPELLLGSQLLTFIIEKVIFNKEVNKAICQNIESVNKFLLNLMNYVENTKFTNKELLINIMIFISKIANNVLIKYETYYQIKVDDSSLFQNDNDDQAQQNTNVYRDLKLEPHPYIILAQTFGKYLTSTLTQMNKFKKEGIITDSDIQQIQEQIKIDILDTVQKTINVQTYKYYAKIIYYILINSNVSIEIKKYIYTALIDIIKDVNVNEKFGNKHHTTVQLLLYVIKHELLDNITIDPEYKKWICDQLLGPALKHITNLDMKNVIVKQQIIEIVYKLILTGQADADNHIFPILSQLILHWTPNENAADYKGLIYVDEDNSGTLDLIINQENTDSAASVGMYKQYGDKAFESGIQIIEKLCTQDSQTLSSVGKGIDPSIKTKAEQFYIKHYKQIQKQYQKGHGHHENLIKYCNLIVDVLPQHITKVFSASCDLFEMDESLAPFRAKYLRKLGQQCGFE